MPYTRYMLLLLVVALIAVSHFVISSWTPTGSKVQAQSTCEGKPQTFTEQGYMDPYWAKNTPVKVYFQSGVFTVDQRNTMKAAIEAWDSRRVQNCSGISFSGYTVTSYSPELSVGPYMFIYKNPNDVASRMYRESGVIYNEIGMDPADPEIGVTMKHEVGHSFNLAHCASCVSIMGVTSVPVADRSDISSCDDESVKRLYCPLVAATPTSTPTPTAGGGGAGGDCYNPYSNPTGAQCPELEPSEPFPLPGSPVVIDVLGDGFALTDYMSGVAFDLNTDGRRGWLSWTAANSDDAWLALDRNGNDTIDDGTELFGNFTPQPDLPQGEQKHGFLALAEYDKPQNGGNGDAVIDRRDAIFTQLRLWQDANHNGISEADELKTLPMLDVAEIDLKYKESKYVDEHGNEFRYRAKVRDASGKKVGKWAYDVFLRNAP